MFSIFPKDDNNQTMRIKRFLIALGSYVMWSTLAVFLYFQEHTRVTFNVLIISLSGIIAINIILYAMIRTGLNKRFKDPSLTLLQIVIATFWAMVVVYYADSFRSVVLLTLHDRVYVRAFQIECTAISFSVCVCRGQLCGNYTSALQNPS